MHKQDTHYFYLLLLLAVLAILGIVILARTSDSMAGQAAFVLGEQNRCEAFCGTNNVQLTTLNGLKSCACLDGEGVLLKAKNCPVQDACW